MPDGVRRRLVLVAALALAAVAASVRPAAAAVEPIGSGAWCWFADPRAITQDGRTYVGWVGPDGDVLVSSIDHATGERVTAVLHSRLDVDDHANPALQIREDGRLAVYYSAHTGGALLHRVSERPGDVSGWGPLQRMPTNTPGVHGFTYPNPQHLASEDTTYLFWRGGNFQPTFSTLADGGESWSPARQLIDGGAGRPYVKFAGDGERTIHFAFTNRHPNEHGDVNVYYAAYRDGEVVRADGTVAGSLDAPIAPADADLVFDRPENAWVHDVAIDPAGRPVIVFASFPAISAHQYHYAAWTGEEWAVHDITAAGGSFHAGESEPMYSGGLTLDHEDPSRVYLSREVEGGWRVEAWTTPDAGATWTSEALSGAGGNFRPIAPRGHGAGFMSVLWMSGEYRTWVDYDTRIVGVSDRPAPPAVDVERSPESGAAPLGVTFDAAAAEGDGGPVTEWSWRFGDGAVGVEGPRAEHVYEQAGSYFPSVTVTDDAGRRDTFVTEVTVAPGPPPDTGDPPPDTGDPPPDTGDPSPDSGDTPRSETAAPPAAKPPPARRLRIRRVRWSARPRVLLACPADRPCRGRLLARDPRTRATSARGSFGLAPGTRRWVRLRLTRRGRPAAAGGHLRVLLVALDRAGRVSDAVRLGGRYCRRSPTFIRAASRAQSEREWICSTRPVTASNITRPSS